MLLIEHPSARWGLWVLRQTGCLRPTPTPCSVSSRWGWPSAHPSPTPGLVKASSGSPSKVTSALPVTTLTPRPGTNQPTMLFLKRSPDRLPGPGRHSPLLLQSCGLSTSGVGLGEAPSARVRGGGVRRWGRGGQDKSSPALCRGAALGGGSLHPRRLTGWGSRGGCVWVQRVSGELWLGRDGQTALPCVLPKARLGTGSQGGERPGPGWARPKRCSPKSTRVPSRTSDNQCWTSCPARGPGRPCGQGVRAWCVQEGCTPAGATPVPWAEWCHGWASPSGHGAPTGPLSRHDTQSQTRLFRKGLAPD